MSFCRPTVPSPVTSSSMLRCVKPPFSVRLAPNYRLFSSYGNAYRSSKRDMQTATAYRPHTLPSSFPIPPTPTTKDSTVTGELVDSREPVPHRSETQNTSTNTIPSESGTPVPKTLDSTPSTWKSPERPRRKLRPRKAALKLTPIAIEQLRRLLSQPDPKLIRVGVKNRGCSGLAYHLEYVEKPGTFDEVVEQDGVKVLIDSKALFSIIGSEMDWQEDKLSARFVFRNPNITLAMASQPRILPPDPPAIDNDPLLVTVRFSASIPDLRLDIGSPETTTAAGLKQAIRTRLPHSLSSHRLRLIYAGRGLEDSTPLAVSLKLPPPPTRFSRSTIDADSDGSTDKGGRKDKGKVPVREPPRLYVHCSIGDIVLSTADLVAEAAIASTLHKKQDTQDKGEGLVHQRHHDSSSSTAPAPRGFDRLLSAGFTATEVAALRSQFMAIQSVSRTPDSMPSGTELRELEDRWMDEGSSAMAAGAVAGGEGASFGDDDGGFGTGSRGAIDDMFWGAIMGFFWPVGCAMWLRREEGIWSWRKGLAVFVGVVVNIAFGAMRIMN
ncbi:DUF2407 C-terminal domain-containing protein [Aspergillus lucknowensis]|uniref:DUF2407 C-terminal domain-containing protein n=1 Tax=Aspergillus lucknowensis TaxID=176173 RepID=A0ABR4LEI4_9EURO